MTFQVVLKECTIHIFPFSFHFPAEEDMSLAEAGGKGRLDYSYYLAASGELSPFVPNTPGELFLAAVFVLPTLAFLLYLAFVFYRCVCSRNYAEWRASWHQQQRAQQQGRGDLYTQVRKIISLCFPRN